MEISPLDNPYASPNMKPQRKESRRELWQRRLTCPHCGQSGISAGVAYLAYPTFRVRCQTCQRRSRVRLTGAARKRFWIQSISAVTLGIAAIAFLQQTDPGSVDDFLNNWLPEIRDSVQTSFGHEWQRRLAIAVWGMTPVTPFLILLLWSIRISLRDVAYSSELIPSDKTASGSAPT